MKKCLKKMCVAKDGQKKTFVYTKEYIGPLDEIIEN